MKRFHLSLARLMVVIGIMAVDCALLARGHFYPEMLLFVPVLQFGLFRMFPGQGRVSPYWAGFELFGWTGVLAWYLGLSKSMGQSFDYALKHLVSYLSTRQTELFHQLRPLFDGEGFLMGVIAILLWGVIVSSPFVLFAFLGGRLVADYARRRSQAAMVSN